MDLTQLLLLAILGICGGVLSGLVGVGGGIVFVPALLYVAGWNITEAVAASLAIIVFSSLSGTIRNARSENPVEWRTAGLLSLAVAPSTLIGVGISRVSPDVVVELAFAALLLALAYPTARGRSESTSGGKIPVALVLLAGVGIGALSGLVGVGGGVLMVPLMVLGMGLTTKTAVSTSLAVVLSAGLVGALGYIAIGVVDLSELPPLIVGAIIGAWIGVRLRDPLPDRALRIGFAGFMALTAIYTAAGAF
jgi:uncharacterized membrane protein YfcA